MDFFFEKTLTLLWLVQNNTAFWSKVFDSVEPLLFFLLYQMCLPCPWPSRNLFICLLRIMFSKERNWKKKIYIYTKVFKYHNRIKRVLLVNLSLQTMFRLAQTQAYYRKTTFQHKKTYRLLWSNMSQPSLAMDLGVHPEVLLSFSFHALKRSFWASALWPATSSTTSITHFQLFHNNVTWA